LCPGILAERIIGWQGCPGLLVGFRDQPISDFREKYLLAEWIRVVSGKPEAQQSSEKREIPQKTMGAGYSIHPSEIPGYFR